MKSFATRSMNNLSNLNIQRADVHASNGNSLEIMEAENVESSDSNKAENGLIQTSLKDSNLKSASIRIANDSSFETVEAENVDSSNSENSLEQASTRDSNSVQTSQKLGTSKSLSFQRRDLFSKSAQQIGSNLKYVNGIKTDGEIIVKQDNAIENIRDNILLPELEKGKTGVTINSQISSPKYNLKSLFQAIKDGFTKLSRKNKKILLTVLIVFIFALMLFLLVFFTQRRSIQCPETRVPNSLGTCIQCNSESVKTNLTCVCTDSNALFTMANNSCDCINKNLHKINGICSQCDNLSQIYDVTQNKCLCNNNFYIVSLTCSPCPQYSSSQLNSQSCHCSQNNYIWDALRNVCKCQSHSFHTQNSCITCGSGSIQNISNQDQCICEQGDQNWQAAENICICNSQEAYILSNICLNCTPTSVQNGSGNGCTCQNYNEIWNQNQNSCECLTNMVKTPNFCNFCTQNALFDTNICICVNKQFVWFDNNTCRCPNKKQFWIGNNCIDCIIYSIPSVKVDECTCNNTNQLWYQNNSCKCALQTEYKSRANLCVSCPNNQVQDAVGTTCICSVSNYIIYQNNNCFFPQDSISSCNTNTITGCSLQCVTPQIFVEINSLTNINQKHVFSTQSDPQFNNTILQLSLSNVENVTIFMQCEKFSNIWIEGTLLQLSGIISIFGQLMYKIDISCTQINLSNIETKKQSQFCPLVMSVSATFNLQNIQEYCVFSTQSQGQYSCILFNSFIQANISIMNLNLSGSYQSLNNCALLFDDTQQSVIKIQSSAISVCAKQTTSFFLLYDNNSNIQVSNSIVVNNKFEIDSNSTYQMQFGGCYNYSSINYQYCQIAVSVNLISTNGYINSALFIEQLVFGQLVIKSCTITENLSILGGTNNNIGIFASNSANSNLQISNSTICQNIQSSDNCTRIGTFSSVTTGSLSVQNCTFVSNSNLTNGEQIGIFSQLTTPDFQLQSCSFSGQIYSLGHSGFISSILSPNYYQLSVQIQNSTFTSTISGDEFVGVFPFVRSNNSATITISSSAFTNNLTAQKQVCGTFGVIQAGEIPNYISTFSFNSSGTYKFRGQKCGLVAGQFENVSLQLTVQIFCSLECENAESGIYFGHITQGIVMALYCNISVIVNWSGKYVQVIGNGFPISILQNNFTGSIFREVGKEITQVCYVGGVCPVLKCELCCDQQQFWNCSG